MMEMLSTPINRKTWVEELHTWLQFNPLAVDMAHVAARQMPIMSTAVKGVQEDKYNFMDFELVLLVTVAIVESGTLRGNFRVDSQITIFQLKNNLLDRLATQPGVDYMLSTLQGPLYDCSWLSEYMWEESKLIFLVPLHPLESQIEAWMWLTVYREWRQAIDSHDGLGHQKQRSWSSPMSPGLSAVVIIHSLTSECGRHLNCRVGLITSWHAGVTEKYEPGRSKLLLHTHQRFDGASWKLRKGNMSLLWWHLSDLRQPSKQPHPLRPRHGPHTPPKAGDLVRICNLPYAEMALFVNRAMAVLTFPVPRQPASHEPDQTSATTSRVSSWEAKILTSQSPDMKRPAGRILLSLHCIQILTSSQQVGKVLRVLRGKEAALEGLENHLPDDKTVTAARAFMKTLTTSNSILQMVPGRQQDKASRPSQNSPSPRVIEPDPRHSEEVTPWLAEKDEQDGKVGTVPLHRESVATDGVRLHESTLVRIREEVGERGAPENFLFRSFGKES